MNTIDSIKTKFLSRHFLWCNNAILIYLALFKLVIHLLTSTGYGYYGDELYYLAETKHLDFGYVDMPPLVPLLMALSNQVFGVSLFALHILPAIAGALTVYFAGLMVRELGGGRFAQWLTALMVIAAPIWLILNSWFAYDPFDQLFTVIFLYLVILILKQETPRRWVIFGIIAGVAIMIKLSIIFTGFALVIALLLTTRRKYLISKWPLFAAFIVLIICAPFLVWQSAHAWPLLKYWHYYALDRPHPGPLQSFLEQIFFLNPVTLPIWILGLYYLLFHREGKKYRVLGLMYLVLQVLFVGIMKLESRMSASAYFPLLAAGAVFTEKLVAALTALRIGWNRLKPVFAGIILLSGLMIAPLALPILPIPTLVKYAHLESYSSLPINCSLRFGWPEMVKKIAVVYNSLPEADRRKCVIYTSTYFEAGAIDFFGRAYGLPGAISNHLSYQIWGLGKYSGEVVIAFGHRFTPGILPFIFNEVTKTNIIVGTKYSMSLEQYLPVYICRKPKTSLKEAWKQLENYSF
jgi:hypothetical protein